MSVSQVTLCIDLGTTGIKAGAFDENLNCLCTSQVENKLLHPAPGLVEQDPLHFFDSATGLIRKILAELTSTSYEIAAISCSGQMAGIMGIDHDWEPVRNYDSILDPRSFVCREMIEEHEELVHRISGGMSTQLEKMLYWRDHFSEAFSRASKIITPNAYVAGKLAGLAAEAAFTDPTFGSVNGIMNPLKMEWSQELIDLFELPREKLPHIYTPETIVGVIDPIVADDLGLPKDVKIVVGAGDGAATYAGSGIFQPGQALDLSGTACAMGVYVDDFYPDTEDLLFLCMKAPAAPGWYLIYVNQFGRTHRWFVEEFCSELLDGNTLDEVYELMDRRASSIDPGCDGMFAIPHLSGRGSPPKPYYRGNWMGFGLGFARAHFYRSLLESHAIELASVLSHMGRADDSLRIREITVAGGGAKSAFWNQLKADVLGVPYKRLSNFDIATLRGNALIAAKALGWPALEGASAMAFDDQYHPDPEISQKYKKVIRDYEAFNASADDALHKMYAC